VLQELIALEVQAQDSYLRLKHDNWAAKLKK
jgi:hypothetical protein